MRRLIASVCILLLCSAPGLWAEPVWQVGERLLPVPAAASPELRAAIAGAGQPNPNSLGVAPATAQEWRELVAAREQDWAVSLKELGDSLGVSISRDTIAGVAVHRVAPAKVAPENTGRLFVYLHGGAYVFRGGDGSVGEGALISAMSGIPAVSIDYRMPPDHPHPAAVLDVLAVYRELLKSHEAAAIGIGGTSAGGGLTLASVHKLKSEGLPLPGALYVGTPWTDLTKTSDSLYTNDSIDRMLVRYDGVLAAAARLYAGDTDLKDPLLSPVYGDFSGFPPTYLVTGTRDMFLSDTARVHRKLRVAGVDADLNVYEGLSHAEYAVVVGSPEWQQVYGELVAFLRKHLAPAKS